MAWDGSTDEAAARASDANRVCASAAAVESSKRGRTDDCASAADATPVSRSELEELLAQAKSSIAADSTSLVKNMERSITDNFSTLIRAVDTSNQKRFGGIEADLLHLQQRMDASESSNKEMRAQLGLVSNALVVAEKPQPTRRDLNADDWDSEPDHSILRINFAQGQHATKVSIESAIRPWMEDTNLKTGQWELIGPASCQRFAIKFIGTAGLGAKRAKAAFTNLKDDTGTYRKMVATSLSSQEVPMFIDENKSKKQLRGEADARRMAKILRDAVPSRTVVPNKRDFQVNVDHIPIVKFEPKAGEESNMRWNNKGLADLGLSDQRPVFLERFRAPRGAASAAEWDG